MATATLTTDLVTIATGEAVDTGTWSGGKASSYWTEAHIQGLGCRAYIVNSVTTYDLIYTPATSVNIGTGSVLRIWANVSDAFRCDIKANGGISIRVSDGTNTGYWPVAGKDTYGGGYIQFIVDTDVAPSTGTTPNWAAVTEVGITLVRTAIGKNTESCFLDAIRYGNKISVTGGTDIDPVTLEDIYLEDMGTNAYGIVTKNINTNAYSLRGELELGDAAGTGTLDFSTIGKVLLAEALDYIGPDVLKLLISGNATGTTDVEFSGCFINAADDVMALVANDVNIDSFSLTGNTLGNVDSATFDIGQIITGNVFDGCTDIYPDQSTFNTNTVANSLATNGAVYIADLTTIAAVNDITLVNYAGTYAIYIPATITADITFDNVQFDHSGIADVYWGGAAGDLNISLINGSNATTYASAGGTVNFLADPIILKVVVVDDTTGLPLPTARVWVGRESDKLELLQDECDVNGEVSVSMAYTADTDVVGWVREQDLNGVDYVQKDISGTITDSGLTLSVRLQPI